jgi:hypothetical protein
MNPLQEAEQRLGAAFYDLVEALSMGMTAEMLEPLHEDVDRAKKLVESERMNERMAELQLI